MARKNELGSVTLLTLHAARAWSTGRSSSSAWMRAFCPTAVAAMTRRDGRRTPPLLRSITRAKDQLYLVRAERRSTFGDYDYGEPSRFLQDIDDSLMLNQGKRSASRRTRYAEDTTWGPSYNRSTSSTRRVSLEPAAVADHLARFKSGMRVRNTTWGDGIVLESKVEADGEETVDVHFESVGFKRLLASLAGLEIIQ